MRLYIILFEYLFLIIYWKKKFSIQFHGIIVTIFHILVFSFLLSFSRLLYVLVEEMKYFSQFYTISFDYTYT